MSVKSVYNGADYAVTNAYKVDVEIKLRELVRVLKENKADKQAIRFCKEKIDNLLYDRTMADEDNFSLLALENEASARPKEQLDYLSQIIMQNTSGSFLKRILGKRIAERLFATLVGILMIAIGFTMIVLPAPHDFEIYTIYYFNPNDGFTLMDLFSLIIVFTGVFLLIYSVRKK